MFQTFYSIFAKFLSINTIHVVTVCNIHRIKQLKIYTSAFCPIRRWKNSKLLQFDGNPINSFIDSSNTQEQICDCKNCKLYNFCICLRFSYRYLFYTYTFLSFCNVSPCWHNVFKFSHVKYIFLYIIRKGDAPYHSVIMPLIVKNYY